MSDAGPYEAIVICKVFFGGGGGNLHGDKYFENKIKQIDLILLVFLDKYLYHQIAKLFLSHNVTLKSQI